jgi:hypothetical protein
MLGFKDVFDDPLSAIFTANSWHKAHEIVSATFCTATIGTLDIIIVTERLGAFKSKFGKFLLDFGIHLSLPVSVLFFPLG